MKKKLYLAFLITLATAFVLSGCNGCNSEAVEDTTEIVSEEISEESTEESNLEDITFEPEDTSLSDIPTEEELAEYMSEQVENGEEVQNEGSETEENDDSNTEETTSKTETSKEVKEEAPAYTVTDMEKTMYAQSSVNVRSGPTTDYEKLGVLNTNDEVKVTGQANSGWYRIEYNGNVGFVSNNYLGDGKVVVQPAPAPTNTSTDTNTTTITPTSPTVDTTNVASRNVNGSLRYAFRTTANGTPIYDGIDWQWPQYLVDIINECCTPEMSDLQKAQAIHDWMATNISYNLETYNHTTYSTLMYREAVCTGYAFAYQSLCCCAGISTSVINGNCYYTSNDEFMGLHAWNFIYIDGVRYHVDATWHMGPSANISLTQVGERAVRIDFYNADGTQKGHYRIARSEDFIGNFDNLYGEDGVAYF